MLWSTQGLSVCRLRVPHQVRWICQAHAGPQPRCPRLQPVSSLARDPTTSVLLHFEAAGHLLL